MKKKGKHKITTKMIEDALSKLEKEQGEGGLYFDDYIHYDTGMYGFHFRAENENRTIDCYYNTKGRSLMMQALMDRVVEEWNKK